MTKDTLENYRRHENEWEEKMPPGGAALPHPCAARPPEKGFLHELLEYSSTTF
jgi:hypothetical protein